MEKTTSETLQPKINCTWHPAYGQGGTNPELALLLEVSFENRLGPEGRGKFEYTTVLYAKAISDEIRCGRRYLSRRNRVCITGAPLPDL